MSFPHAFTILSLNRDDGSLMSVSRHCSRPMCEGNAVATLTYDYGEATVVLGPLAARREPNAYDLCEKHAARLTVPQGWQVIRLAVNEGPIDPDDEDLELLANIVRQASGRGNHSHQNGTNQAIARAGGHGSTQTSAHYPSTDPRGPVGAGGDAWWGPGVARRGHLRVIPGAQKPDAGSVPTNDSDLAEPSASSSGPSTATQTPVADNNLPTDKE